MGEFVKSVASKKLVILISLMKENGLAGMILSLLQLLKRF